MTNPHDVLPLPELLGREGFEVRRANGRAAYVDFDNKQFVVPFDEDAHASLVRAHENMHVQITPRGKFTCKVEGAENRTMQAVEDCRVNSALRSLGIDTSPENPNGLDIAGLKNLAYQEPIEQARSLIGFHGRAEESIVRDVVSDPVAIEAADEIISRFDRYEKAGTVAPWEETIRAIEDLTRKFSKTSEPEPEPSPSEDGEETEPGDSEEDENSPSGNAPSEDESEESEDESDGDNSEASEDESEDDEDGDNGSGESEETEDESDERENSDGSESSDDEKESDEGTSSEASSELDSDDNFMSESDTPLPEMTDDEMKDLENAGLPFHPTWGGHGGETTEMVIHYPPLTKPLPRPRTLSKRASDTGDIPVQVHRLTTDNRIFRERGMGREGIAVLVDCSGSMALSNDDVEAILAEVPASVIAIYGGERNYVRGKPPKGYLYVIAENRRRIEDVRPAMRNSSVVGGTDSWGENLCDVAAVEWLSKRKERRKIFVSDGIATGLEQRYPGSRKSVAHLGAAGMRKLARLILSHRIERFETIPETIEAIKKK